MKTKVFLMILMLLLFHVASCSSSATDNKGEDQIIFDSNTKDVSSPPEDTTTQPDIVPDYSAKGEGKLEFVDEVGDDQKTCIQTTTCYIEMSYNSARTLKVRYLEDGQPKSGVPIKFKLVTTEGNQQGNIPAKLTSAIVYTGSDGIATTKLKSEDQMATFYVKVFVAGNDQIDAIYFEVHVVPKTDQPLSIGFEYEGTKYIEGVTTYLFLNDSTDPEHPTYKCSDIDPLDLPTATIMKSPVKLDQTVKFQVAELPGLEDEGIQFYTIVAIGENQNQQAVIYGCDDKNGVVQVSSGKHVTVVLKDIPPLLAGQYEVETEMDLVSALPDNVETVINTVLDFFKSPSASLMLLICKLNNDSLNDLCQYAFEDPDNPDIDHLTTIGTIIFQIADAFIKAYVEQYTGYDLIGIGDDVRGILKKLKLISTITFEAEPDADGNIPEEKATEKWHTVSFRWSFGQNCDPNDENCGKYNFNIQTIGQDVIVGHFKAKITFNFEKNYAEMTIEPHSLYIKYGALVNYILQHFVLPKIFGDGSDGKPVVDSYEKLLKSLIGGGKDCLAPGPNQPTCCEAFAQKVMNQTSSGNLTEQLLLSSCNALITMGANYLEQQLTGLDAETGDNMIIGINATNPCKLYDSDNDMKIDMFGKKEPVEDRCKWNLKIKISGYETEVENTFYGVRK